MGFFSWLKNLLGPSRPPVRRQPPQPAPPVRIPPGALEVPDRFGISQAPQRPAPPPPPARPEPGSLDATNPTFLPLTHEEVRERAQAIAPPWQTPWFGRRDKIPPTTDPRTNLIDRAMVGQGLITPEELQEIHRVGEEYDRLRPDWAVARHQANLAVEQDKEARAARKAQKKAEAAERQRLHEQAVAHRRATDIIFLGRGVSKGLADRRSNIEKLSAAGLPLLSTPADVAAALKLTIPQLRWLAFHSDATPVTHYVRFTVPKRSGGVRQLWAPHKHIAAAQEWILTQILEKVPTHEAAHGFVPTRSTVTNARLHVGKGLIINADLKDFFPTITFPRVLGIFRQMGYSPAVATILALLCTEAPRREVEYTGHRIFVATGPRSLPQGACTSPALSNLASRSLDRRLSGIAGKLGYAYTRYADDLTFSASGESTAKAGYLLARLRHIAQEEGFAVNEAKTRLQRPTDAQTVTGITVNQGLSTSRTQRRRLRAILHNARKTGLAAQNRQKLPHFESHVRGMISYIAMVNPQQGHKLRSALPS